MQELRSFISLVLSEDAHSRKTGSKFVPQNRLQAFIDDSSPPKRYFTMTSIPKVGINPNSPYKTPIGVYCYPATSEYVGMLIKNTLPFVSDAEHVTFLEAIDLEHMMTVGPDGALSHFSTKKVESIVKDLVPPHAFKDVIDYGNRHSSANPDGILFGATFLITRDAGPTRWTRLLLSLGVTAICDMGAGIIHPSEPTQAVFLSPKAYKVLDSFKTESIRKTHTEDERQTTHKHAIAIKQILSGQSPFLSRSAELHAAITATKQYLSRAPNGVRIRFLLGPGAEKYPTLLYYAANSIYASNDTFKHVMKITDLQFDNAYPDGIEALLTMLRNDESKEGRHRIYQWLLTSGSPVCKHVLANIISGRLLNEMIRANVVDRIGAPAMEYIKHYFYDAPPDVVKILINLGINDPLQKEL